MAIVHVFGFSVIAPTFVIFLPSFFVMALKLIPIVYRSTILSWTRWWWRESLQEFGCFSLMILNGAAVAVCGLLVYAMGDGTEKMEEQSSTAPH
ncbi:hypothetical protein AMECASPLE_027067 [Ameca splendens]|uniref:Amino acid transporter transmembrane domain-containing protein n=1 Tax=Ameca splendens TaxID=208324 RepID=A0ABV0YG96_9TELE